MATIDRVEGQIFSVERFSVIFTQFGRDIRGDREGITGYAGRFAKGAPGRMTVEGWKQRRFRPLYPGFDAEVLLADGTPARGNMRLSSVRSSYQSRR
ncbi:MAG: hypothetical protein JO193_02575 [Candidatus Eremiobacteraeota bacterium]|nr:hypothetical protein [Candidatus Eremiobacteraeota bacterium]